MVVGIKADKYIRSRYPPGTPKRGTTSHLIRELTFVPEIYQNQNDGTALSTFVGNSLLLSPPASPFGGPSFSHLRREKQRAIVYCMHIGAKRERQRRGDIDRMDGNGGMG